MKINMALQFGEIEATYLHDVGLRSVYVFRVNDIPVLNAFVENDDPELMIHVQRPGSSESTKTNGRVRHALHELPPTDGTEVPDGLVNHIDGMTVYTYVVPRLLRFLTELYVNQV